MLVTIQKWLFTTLRNVLLMEDYGVCIGYYTQKYIRMYLIVMFYGIVAFEILGKVLYAPIHIYGVITLFVCYLHC